MTKVVEKKSSKGNDLYSLVKKANEKLPHVVYGDTDSVFISVREKLKEKLSKSGAEISNLDEFLTYNSIKNLNDEYSEDFLLISEKVKEIDKELSQLIVETNNETVKKFGIDYPTTIEFEFEYLLSSFFPVTKKVYVAKELNLVSEPEKFKKGKLINKNIGVKRSDPRITKKILKDLFKFFLSGELNEKKMRDLYSFLIEKSKEILEKAKEFSLEVAIPIGMSKNYSEYSAFSDTLKGVFNWNAYTYYLQKKYKITAPRLEQNSRGFKYMITPATYTRNAKLLSITKKYYEYMDQKYGAGKFKFKNDALNVLCVPFEALENEKIKERIVSDFKVDLDRLFDLAFVSYVNRFLKNKIRYDLYKFVDKDLSKLSDEDLKLLFHSGGNKRSKKLFK